MLTQNQKNRVKYEVDETLKIINGDLWCEFMFLQLMGLSFFDGKVKCDVLYNHATEDMKTYLNYVGNANNVLTITGSGEQILNSILMGAKKIDCFDTNPLAKRASSLKIAAAVSLTREEFLEYFITFSDKLFSKLESNLDEEAKTYWISIYNMVEPNDIKEGLYQTKKLDSKLIKKINMYMNVNEYKRLKSLIEKVDINYFDVALYDLDKVLKDEMYDFINLSNIYEYLVYGKNVNLENAHKYREYVLNYLYPHLNENGKILLAYTYAFNDFVKNMIDEVYNKNPRANVPSGDVPLTKVDNYNRGYTGQNLAYSFLFDVFSHDNITKLPTTHVEFGNSPDKSHDMALILNR